MSESSRPAESRRPVVNETRARQGRLGRHMLWVLLFSTLLAAIGLLLAWAWKAPDLASSNANNGRSNANSPTGPDPVGMFHAPEPAAVVPPPGTDHLAPQQVTPQSK